MSGTSDQPVAHRRARPGLEPVAGHDRDLYSHGRPCASRSCYRRPDDCGRADRDDAAASVLHAGAGLLWPGAHVREANGQSGVVGAVTFVPHPQTMYNLTVAQAHTFFVGSGQWLVHNTCPIANRPSVEAKAPSDYSGEELFPYLEHAFGSEAPVIP